METSGSLGMIVSTKKPVYTQILDKVKQTTKCYTPQSGIQKALNVLEKVKDCSIKYMC